MSYLSKSFRNCFKYSGVASRHEFWMTQLGAAVAMVTGLVLWGIAAFSGGFLFGPNFYLFALVVLALVACGFSLSLTVVNLALGYRRLTDAGAPGWLTAGQLIPGLGLVALVIIGLLPSKTKLSISQEAELVEAIAEADHGDFASDKEVAEYKP